MVLALQNRDISGLLVLLLGFGGALACGTPEMRPSPSGTCGDGIKVNSEACDDSNTLSGDGCSAQCEIEARFTCEGSGPESCYCLPLYTGSNCDRCKDVKYTGDNCDMCADGRFAGAECDECSDARFVGNNCDQCADTRFKGPECDVCTDARYQGANCDECADERFTGANCDQCVDSRYTGPNCDQCADSRLTGPNCDQCVNPNFAAPTCTTCLPQFAGTNCDRCSNDHFALPACDVCLPRFTGANCELCTNDHYAQPDCTACLPRFTGASCEECTDERFGTPECNTCADSRFSGASCDETACQMGEAYGESCWPIVPSSIPACFDDTMEVMCPGTAGDNNCGMTAYCGQDGQYAARNARTFICVDAMGQDLTTCSSTVSDGETVRDTLTGLVWTRSEVPDATPRSWSLATSYCNNLEYGGQTDWRLANMQELFTLLDYHAVPGGGRTYVDIFPQIPGEIYWTGTTDARAATRAWYINFGTTSISSIGKIYGYRAQCVRGGGSVVAPGQRFRDSRRNNEFVVIDNLTGLMWQNELQSSKTWQEALSFCESSTYGGFDDWRLPKITSLFSIIDFDRESPATALRNFTSDRVWSSSSLLNPVYALQIDFRNGQILTSSKIATRDFGCVR